MKIFIFPGIVAALALVGAFVWGGVQALFLVALLAVLETTLSFDNAVVNAKVLTRMDAKWQRRFLIYGIPVAVFGTRFVLPIFIVAAAAGLSPIFVTELAFFDAAKYGEYLDEAHTAIAGFGSTFLLMVSLKYFFNDRKTIHWITTIEKHLSRWGGIEAIEVALSLVVLVVCAMLVPAEAATILISGIIGIVLFIIIEGIAQSFEMEAGAGAVSSGLALFVYLNVLDAAFSLDGVVGAFAITSALPVIIAGLGIGAVFVRAFTVALVRAHTLKALPYLEHGAHWAIFGLALAMLLGIFVHVPEAITGFIGLVFITFAYISSRREMRAGIVTRLP
ncbi:hypothetical protein A2763_00090 [Candidatus Kaiserbacteria bacterium RIFCSPHIGHO2_01_FULL_54_36]|uniref:DUF475 domain-containing protein n=1 Tax=Candidatus Kaiserbacteria bacterium RIFCSPHIGHO2_01_FULL_54_36 TaxID=1798482 RepID=A0A1F6CPQ1_9BACT|nr:MAG: hypothetical protein A2763_00090 [Candidatus Kaiserbacteria bacterium RIFCSPHIGHO2_01_FULL_54_36]OGG75190.1 MAG: hypothetical protein A3A41_03635 [Candidatus Kaiserbacteria bacterium RIFCSPLOWO2_01_FULL_54_22]